MTAVNSCSRTNNLKLDKNGANFTIYGIKEVLVNRQNGVKVYLNPEEIRVTR